MKTNGIIVKPVLQGYPLDHIKWSLNTDGVWRQVFPVYEVICDNIVHDV